MTMGSIADSRCPKCGHYSHEGDVCMKCATLPAASQAKVQAKLLGMGLDVALPTRENGPYDLLMLGSYEWLTVQVKTAYPTKEGTRVNIARTSKTGRKKYREDEVAYFAVVDEDDVYLIPYRHIHAVGRANIRATKYAQWRI